MRPNILKQISYNPRLIKFNSASVLLNNYWMRFLRLVTLIIPDSLWVEKSTFDVGELRREIG